MILLLLLLEITLEINLISASVPFESFTDFSINKEINKNLTAYEDPLIAENIKTVFDKNVSPN